MAKQSSSASRSRNTTNGLYISSRTARTFSTLTFTLFVYSLYLQFTLLDYCHHQNHHEFELNGPGGLANAASGSIRSRFGHDYLPDAVNAIMYSSNQTAAGASSATAMADTNANKTTSTADPYGRDTLSIPTSSRVLVGIFTADNADEQQYRSQFRKLLKHDPRVCPLFRLQQNVTFRRHFAVPCEYIYTFVAGGNPTGPTELVDGCMTMVVDKSKYLAVTEDVTWPDVTLLNIKENMNEGKSQTWFVYAANIMEELGIDYVAKQDTDSMIFFDRYFDFAHKYLPPAPFANHILAGSVADKWWWNLPLESDGMKPKESYFTQKYGRPLHLYVQGQFYLMSRDLAEVVRLEANDGNKYEYMAGHEDHDVSAFIFRANQPINLVIIGLEERFWQHRVKLKLGVMFERIWDAEKERLKGIVNEQFQIAHDNPLSTA